MTAITQLNHLNAVATATASAANKASGAFTITANRPLLIYCAFRSQDVADVSGETMQCVGSLDGTYTLVNHVAYDSSTRMMAALFKCSDATPGASKTVTLSFVSGRLTGRQLILVEEVQDAASDFVVQSAVADNESVSSPLAASLAAFGNAANFTVMFGSCNANDLDMTVEAGWTALVDVTSSTFGGYIAGYLASNDTTPTITYAATPRLAGIAVELKGATAAGAAQAYNYLNRMKGN